MGSRDVCWWGWTADLAAGCRDRCVDFGTARGTTSFWMFLLIEVRGERVLVYQRVLFFVLYSTLDLQRMWHCQRMGRGGLHMLCRGTHVTVARDQRASSLMRGMG